MSNCVFCGIVAGTIPAELVARSEQVIAFRDINPIAPVHVLIVPTVHVENVGELASHKPELLAEMGRLAQAVAQEQCGGQFRWVFNTGASAGQSVFHVHGHVIGGKELSWNVA